VGANGDCFNFHEDAGSCQACYLEGAAGWFVGLFFGAEIFSVAGHEAREIHLVVFTGIAYQVNVHHHYVGKLQLLRLQRLLDTLQRRYSTLPFGADAFTTGGTLPLR
jgi:hypothetical protein